MSQSCDNASELSTPTSVKPTKVLMVEGCIGKEIESLRDDSPASASKMRKIIKKIKDLLCYFLKVTKPAYSTFFVVVSIKNYVVVV